jgi:hypothetical protein
MLDVSGPAPLTPVVSRDAHMSTPIRPWSKHRQILWALGVFGLLVLVCSLAVAWVLRGGFGPGARTSPPDLADLLGTALLAVPCVYYIVVPQRVWTRKLWATGIIIHLLVLLLLVAVVLAGRGRSLTALPFLLGGTVAWILYARRNAFSQNSG